MGGCYIMAKGAKIKQRPDFFKGEPVWITGKF